MALLVVAAIKNPTEIESKTIVQEYTLVKFQELLNDKFDDNGQDKSNLAQFIKRLCSAFIAKLWDPFLAPDVQTTDYLVFSTFDCTIVSNCERKTLVSGIILFGKIIPLYNGINEECLNS